MKKELWIKELGVDKFLELNIKLQKKKNEARKILVEKGVLKKEGTNNFDKYKYFTEAQYKKLTNEIFVQTGLDIKFSEIEYQTFEGTEKQSNGRMPKLEFELMDSETGFSEITIITGEGIDKGDKAGYKAYTGALKYFLANTFLIATGDDAEKESPSARMNNKVSNIDEMQNRLNKMNELNNLLDITGTDRGAFYLFYKVKSNKEMTIEQLNDAIEKLKKRVK